MFMPKAELQNVTDMTNISLYKKIDSLGVKSLGGAKQSHFWEDSYNKWTS